MLGLLLLSCSAALAANTGPSNLKNISFCFNSDKIQISSETALIAPNLKSEIFKKVSTKLKAYRILYDETCTISKTVMYLQVDTTQAKNANVSYTLVMDIYDTYSRPGVVSIYNSGRFGTDPYTGKDLTDDFVSQYSDLVDSFAADYATANP